DGDAARRRGERARGLERPGQGGEGTRLRAVAREVVTSRPDVHRRGNGVDVAPATIRARAHRLRVSRGRRGRGDHDGEQVRSDHTAPPFYPPFSTNGSRLARGRCYDFASILREQRRFGTIGTILPTEGVPLAEREPPRVARARRLSLLFRGA